jgi:hypothetical protein
MPIVPVLTTYMEQLGEGQPSVNIAKKSAALRTTATPPKITTLLNLL